MVFVREFMSSCANGISLDMVVANNVSHAANNYFLYGYSSRL